MIVVSVATNIKQPAFLLAKSKVTSTRSSWLITKLCVLYTSVDTEQHETIWKK